MVRALHEAGIEVILDVVYNHTAEGNHMGPTVSMRGIDNAAYYRLVEDDKRYYMDYTGTGNSLNVGHPHSLQLIMDSLRYWVTEMHVDGFRFDLAAALAREFYDVDRLSAFFELVQQDPTVSQVKLIAEPWDVGPGGYQVGNFPPQWTEWNGKYRDTVRDFWRGEDASLGEFASRLTGSADLYEHTARRPVASINFVTAHDGFTLRDLVSYNDKHNDANGENNNDGDDVVITRSLGVVEQRVGFVGAAEALQPGERDADSGTGLGECGAVVRINPANHSSVSPSRALGGFVVDEVSSVRDEAFYEESELEAGEGGEKVSPQGTPVEWTAEETWFFRLSNTSSRCSIIIRPIPSSSSPTLAATRCCASSRVAFGTSAYRAPASTGACPCRARRAM